MTPATEPFGYHQLPETFRSPLAATDFAQVDMIALNKSLAADLGIDASWLNGPEGLALLSGQSTLSGGDAIAMAYCGFQFGQWSGLLGDGRARLVGDVTAPDGLRYELHLKGAGRTPYSRGGDGKATLGSAIREYLVSEAMAALGVPTTRALSVVTTGEPVQREMPQQGAVLCRSARSHVRVGTFQFAASLEEVDHLSALADFTIDRLLEDVPQTGAERYKYLLRQAIASQADLIVQWMLHGFIHGVMNTDNMCISGETIDYGPCAFMDEFHPAKVFSSIDQGGRYAWNKQPEIANWNLYRFAETLAPLLGETEEEQQTAAEHELTAFPKLFQEALHASMARKLGIAPDNADLSSFINATFQAMAQGQVDFTIFFRNLTLVAGGEGNALLLQLFSDQTVGEDWLESWKAITGSDARLPADMLKHMQDANPIVIARNHRVEQAIADAEQGNLESFHRLLSAVSQPFVDRSAFAEFERPPEPEEVVQQTFCGT